MKDGVVQEKNLVCSRLWMSRSRTNDNQFLKWESQLPAFLIRRGFVASKP